MNLRFAESEDDIAALRRFNDRLRAGGREEAVTLRLKLPGEIKYRPEGFPVCRRVLIAEDGEEVRSALMLYHHNIYLNGQKRDFCWSDNLISEGIVNRKYSITIIQLLKKALAYQPFLIGVGNGSLEIEAHQIMLKFGWKQKTVPFFFYPVRATKVLLGMSYLRQNQKLRYGAAFGGYSGLGIGLSGLLGLHRNLTSSFSGYESVEVDMFEDWSDRIFEQSLPDYKAAVRADATSLNIIYSPDDPAFTRLRVRRKNTKEDAGWIVVASKQMNNNIYFGDLRVGTLVDGFGRAEYVGALVAAGLKYLAGAGVDLVVGNFSHGAWVRGCKQAGMFSGPSKFQIFVAPGGAPLLEETLPLHDIHVVRGHGGGMSGLV